MRILVTGAAGFIGMHLCERLLDRGDTVLGLDNLNDYYAPQLKRDRLARLLARADFHFSEADLTDRPVLDQLVAGSEAVAHLAAQAGVRHSLTHPHTYLHSNLQGFGELLEACRHHRTGHLVYASTSSVYGSNAQLPYSPHAAADHPVTLYAATKRANELMAHAYSHLYRLPATGLRFFTVYGPWGRPDMAPCLFADAILHGRPIDLFNHGAMARDFTYVDDVVEALVRVIDRPAVPDPAFDRLAPDPATSDAPWRLYNVGNQVPVDLETFVTTLEHCLGVPAERRYRPMQAGDVERTWADVDDLVRDVAYAPATPLAVGLSRFADWYRAYHG